jgi:hypothetical protein
LIHCINSIKADHVPDFKLFNSEEATLLVS